MITLTTPPQINSVLGGTAPIAYNKLVLGPFTMDGVTQTVRGTLRLTSTASPSMQPITGTLTITVPSSDVTVEVAQLDFYRRITSNSGQNTAVLGIIETAQASLENGLISLGLIGGTRTAGV